jgi:N-acetylmuramoyl-L-alanine amidase
MADPEAQEYRHKWTNVIEVYERALGADPDGEFAAESTAAIGRLYLGLYTKSRRESDLDHALDWLARAARDHHDSAVAATAQLALGHAYYQYKADADRAFIELLKVELNHPQAVEEVKTAKRLMAEISGADMEAAAREEGVDLARIMGGEGGDPACPPDQSDAPKRDAVLQNIRHWHNPEYSRVAVDLTRPTVFHDHILRQDPSLNKPIRLYIDLENTRVSPNIRPEHPIADGLLKRARVAQYDQDTVRVVLDIESIDSYRIFSLEDPFRIVVDVSGEPVKTAAATDEKEDRKKKLADLRETAKKRPKVPRGPARTKPDAASLARQLGLGVKRVIIDPGHGGKDHGATGVNGTREKDLTLKVARMLAEKIEKQLGLDVVLTRNKDVFLPLEERTALANTHGADLFISIHANAHRSAGVHGIETYFLNLATDAEAMRVAARENATTQKNMSDLQVILSDLMLNSKISESADLCGRVHQSMVGGVSKKYKNIRDLGVKQAPFYVLIGANMPSVLIEMGFISNAAEEKRLNNPAYMNTLTDGIVRGVQRYNESIKKAAS